MEVEEITMIHSNLLGTLVYKVSVRIVTVFTCNYCCFCWLCKVMKLEKYITEDVGSCCDRMYVFKLVDCSADTDDFELYKEVKEIETCKYDEEEEQQLVRLARDMWLEEKGFFKNDTLQ